MTPGRWQQIEDLYNAVRDGAPSRRATLLAQADPEVRLEVEKLLDQPDNSSRLRGALDAAMAAVQPWEPQLGSQLGPYRIEALLGAGGMGSVYRAVDTRLKRRVAIKVPKTPFDCRFEREARAIAALNHPNVCTVHDVGPNYLVMELVEGPTLADRIKLGAIPLPEALAIARQVTEALEAAHDLGIVHRDLKPVNIKITPDGMVKVLDFGLARVGTSTALLSNDETRTAEPTLPGQIVGTPAYMAPEQARGEAVDKRADIWAFGILFFEMLAAEKPFSGSSLTDTLAAVVTRDPDWAKVPSQTRRLLRHCLEKDRKRRLRDIGDVWRLLDEPHEPPPVYRKTPWLAAAMLLVAFIAIALWKRPAPSGTAGSPPVLRMNLDLGPDTSVQSRGANVVLSPDGLNLAYTTLGPDGTTHLFTRRLDQSQPTELAGTDGAYAPFYSPDGNSIGFFAPGKMKTITATGGPITTLCDAPTGRGASWSENGEIIFTPDVQSRLMRVAAVGGSAPVPVAEFLPGEISHRWPQVLPGGKAVLFTALTAANFAAFDEASIQVLSLTDGHRKKLHQGGSYGRYLPSGHLLFVRNRTAFVVPFEIEKLEVHGNPAPVLEQVTYVSSGGAAQIDLSATGTLVYQSGPPTPETIQWMDASGRLEELLPKTGSYLQPRLSPDGKRLMYRKVEGSSADIWVYDWQRGIETRLTHDTVIHNSPTWSSDGRYVAYQAEGGRSKSAPMAPGNRRCSSRTRTRRFPSPSHQTEGG
jgi:serine/threonine-protein kinase